jgi:hypothetical protein
VPKEFVSLRVEMYSLCTGEGKETRQAAKETKNLTQSSTSDKIVQFLKVLYEKEPTKAPLSLKLDKLHSK